MKLGEKLRYLRQVEGELRNLNRPMQQGELVQAIAAELGASLSQPYLSQIESGARPHLTATTRQTLATFFKVHPGYLVDDPEGYQAELLSDASTIEEKLDLWLVAGAERFRRDPDLRAALLTLSRHHDSRRCLLMLASMVDAPGLVDRMCAALAASGAPTPCDGVSPPSASEALPLAEPKPTPKRKRKEPK